MDALFATARASAEALDDIVQSLDAASAAVSAQPSAAVLAQAPLSPPKRARGWRGSRLDRATAVAEAEAEARRQFEAAVEDALAEQNRLAEEDAFAEQNRLADEELVYEAEAEARRQFEAAVEADRVFEAEAEAAEEARCQAEADAKPKPPRDPKRVRGGVKRDAYAAKIGVAAPPRVHPVGWEYKKPSTSASSGDRPSA
jgi:hypothetical protein